MSVKTEQAQLFLERLLVSEVTDDADAQKFIADAIALRDAETLRLASEAICVHPHLMHLTPLWSIVENKTIDDQVRAAAFAGIGGLLVASWSELDEPDPMDPLELLDDEGLDAQIAQLLRVYRDSDYPGVVRRRALEAAANVSDDDQIKAAGLAAFQANDPQWRVSGLFVLRLVDPTQCRKHINEALQSDVLDLRLEAIRGLADLAEGKDFDRLAKIVRRGGEEARVALLELSDIPDERASQIISDAAESDDEELRAEAEEAYEMWLESWAGFSDQLIDELGIDEWD